ncbi:MAG: EF-hand domain-containing protein [Burkholderiales bacterium]|nr:EF-hand domain-containing protein [Burkholderiales bacterium]
MKTARIAAWLALLALPAQAADESMIPRADPWVPPAARRPSLLPPTEGAALQAQVNAKLLQRFAAADTAGYGSITAAQAQRAGLGFVSQHFERIDTQRTGSVTFQELRRFLENSAAHR